MNTVISEQKTDVHEEKRLCELLTKLLDAADNDMKELDIFSIKRRDYGRMEQCNDCGAVEASRTVHVRNTITGLQTTFSSIDVHRITQHDGMSQTDRLIVSEVILN